MTRRSVIVPTRRSALLALGPLGAATLLGRSAASYDARLSPVANRGIPPTSFLDELVAWGKSAQNDLFVVNNRQDIYWQMLDVLGPWMGPRHRRAAMLEVLRVLAGLESAWTWDAGRDENSKYQRTPETAEAGAWQISANSMQFGSDLVKFAVATVGSIDPIRFQETMKSNHNFAMEYTVRLLRHTTQHNGPVLRREIDAWVRRDAVAQFEHLLTK